MTRLHSIKNIILTAVTATKMHSLLMKNYLKVHLILKSLVGRKNSLNRCLAYSSRCKKLKKFLAWYMSILGEPVFLEPALQRHSAPTHLDLHADLPDSVKATVTDVYQLGGQQQRAALARALAVKPEVLLLDEPLSALDAKIRVSPARGDPALQRELGITTVFVTHDQEEALSISDRIVVMNEGRADQIGTPSDIYNNPTTRFVASFVGTLNLLEARGRSGGRRLSMTASRWRRRAISPPSASPTRRRWRSAPRR